jgi:hypothetical protein
MKMYMIIWGGFFTPFYQFGDYKTILIGAAHRKIASNCPRLARSELLSAFVSMTKSTYKKK